MAVPDQTLSTARRLQVAAMLPVEGAEVWVEPVRAAVVAAVPASMLLSRVVEAAVAAASVCSTFMAQQPPSMWPLCSRLR
jgi:hypothetical protein